MRYDWALLNGYRTRYTGLYITECGTVSRYDSDLYIVNG